MHRRINEVAETDTTDVDTLADAIAERLNAKPLHQLDASEFKTRAAETWADVFASTPAPFCRGALVFTDFTGPGDNAA